MAVERDRRKHMQQAYPCLGLPVKRRGLIILSLQSVLERFVIELANGWRTVMEAALDHPRPSPPEPTLRS